jgi:microcystin-dependent protein
MSIMLDRILAQSTTMYPATVALSSEDVTVLLYAISFLEKRSNWLDRQEDLADEITVADWDEIEKLVANLAYQVENPMIGLCFPLVLGGVPDNCLPLDGGTYERTDYPILYDLLDDAFIVDTDNFILPDMRSRVAIGSGTGTGLSTYTVNQQGGQEAITLSTGQIPSHQHGIFQGVGLAVAPGELPVKTPALVAGDSTDLTGGGGSHENRQPFTALPWVVIAK